MTQRADDGLNTDSVIYCNNPDLTSKTLELDTYKNHNCDCLAETRIPHARLPQVRLPQARASRRCASRRCASRMSASRDRCDSRRRSCIYPVHSC